MKYLFKLNNDIPLYPNTYIKTDILNIYYQKLRFIKGHIYIILT
jgi:hypothetical protein